MGGLAKVGDKRASVHLRLVKDEPLKGQEKRKTDVFTLCMGASMLGKILWYSQWRRYVFQPRPTTVYDPLCLDQIATMCREKTKEHDERIKRKRKRAAAGDA